MEQVEETIDPAGCLGVRGTLIRRRMTRSLKPILLHRNIRTNAHAADGLGALRRRAK
jgi:hypothetical protein